MVCTGGEPLLQVDDDLISALHAAGFEIGVESNGTLAAPDGIDWLCVSPKGSAPVVQTSGQELKLVYPQSEPEAQPENFAGMDFQYFYLQPLDSPDVEQNTRDAVEYCLSAPAMETQHPDSQSPGDRLMRHKRGGESRAPE